MSEINEFYLGVERVAKNEVDKAPYDKTYKGTIEQVNQDGTCSVKIIDKLYQNIQMPSGLVVGSIVDVLFPQNNASMMEIVHTVTSVNGKTGAVVLSESDLDITESITASSNTWSWKKYPSGMAIMWGIFDVSPTDWQQAGSIYYSDSMSISLPFAVTGGVCSGVSNAVAYITNASVESDTLWVRAARWASINSLRLQLTIFGKWK